MLMDFSFVEPGWETFAVAFATTGKKSNGKL